MNKLKYLLMMLLPLLAVQSRADAVSVADIEATAGGSAEIVINFSTTATNLTGYQMSLYLPEGVTLQKDEDDEYAYTLSSRHNKNHVFSVNEQTDGGKMLVCYSMTKKTIAAGNGELLRLPVDVAATATGNLTVQLRTIKFSDTSSNVSLLDDVTFSIVSSAPEKTEQTLQLVNLPTMKVGDADYDLPTETAEGMPLTWTSSNPAVATVSGHVLTVVGAGTATITATQAGNDTYQAFTRQFVLVVNEADMSIDVTDVSQIANVIYMEPREETKGTEVTVPILMKNTAQIRGFQFDLYLPEGVTMAKMANNRFMASLSNGRKPESSVHTLTVSEQQDGAIRFLCGSQYDETFTGSEGEIATIKLVLADDMAEGSYPVVLKNVKLTETNISNYYLTETVQTALNVVSYTPGDISGDGIIDVSDYIGVANYILGEEQDGIVAAAADVNKDQVVDVSDYIGVANLILYDNIFGQTANAARGLRKANTDISGNDNVIYIEPLQTPSNTQLQLSLKMKNTAAIRGFQTDVYLPEGVTAVKNSNGRYLASLTASRLPAGSAHTLTVSEQPDGAIRLLCGSQYDETFTGSDGEIATLTINVSGDMNPGDYPILLRYVKLTETNISNYYLTDEVETTMNVTGPSDGRVTFDENATALPDYTAGETANVCVKRSIKANEWSTICLPFAMNAEQCKAAFGEDVRLADFNDYVFDDESGTMSVKFTDTTSIEANHPYLIRVDQDMDEFTAYGVDIDPQEAVVDFDTSRRKNQPRQMVGTYEAGTTLDWGTLFLSDNQFWYSIGNTKMKAFRAYFNFIDLLPDFEETYESRSIRMVFDDTTGIKTVGTAEKETEECYTLQGLRVQKSAKGIFIINGKKVVKK